MDLESRQYAPSMNPPSEDNKISYTSIIPPSIDPNMSLARPISVMDLPRTSPPTLCSVASVGETTSDTTTRASRSDRVVALNGLATVVELSSVADADV